MGVVDCYSTDSCARGEQLKRKSQLVTEDLSPSKAEPMSASTEELYTRGSFLCALHFL